MLAYPAGLRARRRPAAVAVLRGGPRGARRPNGRNAPRSCSAPTETLHATYRALRDELLETIARTGSRLGELRFDTDLDVSHAVVRYLEVVKLAALIDRAELQGPAEALPEINARLSAR